MGKHKILLVEDDPNLGFLIQENLEMQGYAVKLCRDGEAGLSAYQEESFDLCLLDVMLPKKDGFVLATEIRGHSQRIPIIFLTAKSLKEDRIEGFKLGGDDYITKPFSLEELVLRIQAVLKRSAGVVDSTTNCHEIGKYIFDYESQTLRQGEKLHKLTAKEAELLKLLCVHKNNVLDRQIALKQIWGEDNYFNGRSMDVFISKLRKYLSEDRNIEIKNIHGKGFKLIIRGG